ncbi:relaxin receptor 2-like [Paramacrobiotus metropolitanus]|uniref:relaxin receptor 2-like n=1 Tax=Paramacrobiotus metropolitanus TaxID=2943436 RepID=UPI00244590CC|nr:relaxin receptor 2-like [Paramacrobiotus metropolitanus]
MEFSSVIVTFHLTLIFSGALCWDDAGSTRNHGPCSKFEFPCNNSGVCVTQQKWCNHEADCPDGDDEMPHCQAKALTWDDFQSDTLPCINEVRRAKRMPRIHFDFDRLLTSSPSTDYTDDYDDSGYCSLVNFPASCQCKNGRSLECKVDGKLPNLSQVEPSPTLIELRSKRGTMGCLRPNRQHNGYYSQLDNLLTLNFSNSGLRCIHAFAFRNHNLATLDLSHNLIRHLMNDTFSGLNVCSLFLNDNTITDWTDDPFNSASAISWLDLRNNDLTLEQPGMLQSLRSTCVLELTGNLVRRLTNNTFKGLTRLCNVELSYNEIESIESGAFADLHTTGTINLKHNRLSTLDENLFQHNHNLRQLELAYNSNITTIPVGLFRNFNCTKLDLRGILISNIEEEMFHTLPSTCNVLFEKLYYCFYAHHIRNCTPKVDGISSFEELLVSPTLVTLAWISAIFTIICNLLIYITRWYLDRTLKHGVHDMVVRDARIMSLFIKHLSFSDMLTGFYMLFICYYNDTFKGQYHRYALDWINSIKCQVLGITAMSSAEISMLILTFIAIDRALTICCTNKKLRLSIWSVRVILIFIWLLGIALAIIPAIIWNDRVHNYYGNNGVCLPLYLQEPRLNGWIYSLAVVFGLNGLLIVVIACCYAAIFCSVKKWGHDLPVETEEKELFWRFFVLVCVNLCCWLPTFVFKFIALTNHKVPDESYAWIVTFVFPLNSAMNPIVYSLSSREFRARVGRITGYNTMKQYVVHRVHYIGRRLSTWSTNTSSDLCHADSLPFPDGPLRVPDGPPPPYSAMVAVPACRRPRGLRPSSVHFPLNYDALGHNQQLRSSAYQLSNADFTTNQHELEPLREQPAEDNFPL